MAAPPVGLPAGGSPRLLSRVRDAVRLKGYSSSTEDLYCHWIKRFVLFHNKRHPDQMAVPEVGAFLTHLAQAERLSSSSQNQALSALLFLYKVVLRTPLDAHLDFLRSKPHFHVPAVLTREEVTSILLHLSGTKRLMAELLYGSGMRLLEIHRLRVGDIDLEERRVLVWDGKGRKDRTTILPTSLVEPLRAHIARVAALHKDDLRQGLGRALLPHAYDRKSPSASGQLRWQFAFPSAKTFHDPRTGNSGRWHVNPSTLQNAFRRAVQQSGVLKHATVHTLRHSFATHMLQSGCDIRTLQALLGHNQVNTTMIYAHICDNLAIKTPSPLDDLALPTSDA